MKTPCLAKMVFGPVWTSPSAPPSFTVTWPICQIDRRVSRIDPGMTASNVVEMEHVPPIVVDPVATHGTVTPNGTPRATYPARDAVPLRRSVIRIEEVTSTSPV